MRKHILSAKISKIHLKKFFFYMYIDLILFYGDFQCFILVLLFIPAVVPHMDCYLPGEKKT